MNPKIVGLTASLWMLGSVSTAHADFVVYSYTGNPFTTVSGPYTTTDFITADLVLDNPMVAAPGTQIDATTLAGFSLTANDKVQTLSSALGPLLVADFALNGSGNIASWEVILAPTAPTLGEIETNFGPISPVGNLDQSIFVSGGFAYNAYNANNPGTWTKTCFNSAGGPTMCPPFTGVPEPATLGLLGLGLAGIGLTRRKRASLGRDGVRYSIVSRLSLPITITGDHKAGVQSATVPG